MPVQRVLDDRQPKSGAAGRRKAHRVGDQILAIPRSDLRLFGKPEAFTKRRMGVAVANGDTIGPPGNPDCRGQPVKTPENQP